MGENFNRVFAESGGKTAISDSQYSGGMNFIGDVPPEFEDHNAIFNEQDKKLLELKTDGVASWDAGISYFANRSTVTGSDGNLYKCEIDNTSVNPVGDLTGTWLKIPSVDAYEILLPLGNYTSGTYALPNSTTWSDYSSIRVVQRVSNTDVFTSADITSEILDLSAWGVRADVDQTDFAEVTRASSTEFSVTRGGNDEIAMILGWRK